MAINKDDFSEKVDVGLKANKSYTHFYVRFKIETKEYSKLFDYSDKNWDKRTRITKAKTDAITFKELTKTKHFAQAAIFDETSDNEKEHAKIWFKILNKNHIGDTLNNLKEAANGEQYEWTKMYKEFATIAREEGFIQIANLFEKVGSIEKMHDERYLKLASNIENNKVFSKDEETIWICRNCGYVYYGYDALKVCPVCNHPESFMEVKAHNY